MNICIVVVGAGGILGTGIVDAATRADREAEAESHTGSDMERAEVGEEAQILPVGEAGESSIGSHRKVIERAEDTRAAVEAAVHMATELSEACRTNIVAEVGEDVEEQTA